MLVSVIHVLCGNFSSLNFFLCWFSRNFSFRFSFSSFCCYQEKMESFHADEGDENYDTEILFSSRYRKILSKWFLAFSFCICCSSWVVTKERVFLAQKILENKRIFKVEVWPQNTLQLHLCYITLYNSISHHLCYIFYGYVNNFLADNEIFFVSFTTNCFIIISSCRYDNI